MTPAIEINEGKAPRYGIIDENGKPTGEFSEKSRTLSPDEAMLWFGTDRLVRVGVAE